MLSVQINFAVLVSLLLDLVDEVFMLLRLPLVGSFQPLLVLNAIFCRWQWLWTPDRWYAGPLLRTHELEEGGIYSVRSNRKQV